VAPVFTTSNGCVGPVGAVALVALLPIPSCPLSFFPQQLNAPPSKASRMVHEKSSPTWMTLAT